MINEHAHQLHGDLCSTEALGELHIHLSGELHRGPTQLHIGMSRIEKEMGLSVQLTESFPVPRSCSLKNV